MSVALQADISRPKWRSVKLGDILTLINGRAYKKDEERDSGTPVLRIQNLNGGDRWFYSDLSLPENKYCENGDLLFAWSATFGPYIWWGEKVIYHYHIWKIECGPELDKKFAYYLLQHITERVKAAGRGISMIHMTKGGMEDWDVSIPPLDEQKRIAAVLDQADELRRKRQRAIDRLHQLGQAIFHEMFGDPVAPSDRLASRLIDIAELINGDRSSNYPSGDDIKDEGILFLNTTNIRDGELDFTKAQFITEAKFRSLSRGKLQRGDLVITLRGTLGQCALFDCEYETGFINAQMMIIRARKDVLPRFLREYISFPSVQAKLKRANSGSAVPQLTATQMKDMQILLPTLDNQKKFVQAVDTARSVQNEFVAHSNWLVGLFASLQHRAFQGEL